jgi:hypothetical protein
MKTPHPLLSQSLLKQYVTYDLGVFRFKSRNCNGWNPSKNDAVAGSVNQLGYTTITIDGRRYLAHRLAWLYVYGIDPGDLQIDHIDKTIPLSNKIENLRIATESENACHSIRPKTYASAEVKTPYRGVQKSSPNRWKATIEKEGVIHYLGSFDNPEDARDAYIAAANRLHKEFAVLD